MTTLEFPLNEKMRAFLRAEELFARLLQLIDSPMPVHHHYAVEVLFDLQELFNRSDIKTDLIRDLEKQKQVLETYRGHPHILEATLEYTLQQFQDTSQALHAMGKPGQSLSQEDGLSALKNRIHVASCTCAFDLPAFHFWKSMPLELKQQTLREWASHYEHMAKGLQLYLDMVRQTGSTRTVVAFGGQFQQNMPTNKSFQLLKITPHHDQVIPEISANHLLIMIRWLACDERMRTQTLNEEISFDLTLCIG